MTSERSSSGKKQKNLAYQSSRFVSEEAGQAHSSFLVGGVLRLRSCEKMRSSSAVIETAIILILPAGSIYSYFFGVQNPLQRNSTKPSRT